MAAVIASTNQHVDALNATIQRARHLDPTVTAPIGGGAWLRRRWLKSVSAGRYSAPLRLASWLTG